MKKSHANSCWPGHRPFYVNYVQCRERSPTDFSWGCHLVFADELPDDEGVIRLSILANFGMAGLPVTGVAIDVAGGEVWLVGEASNAFTSTDVERICEKMKGRLFAGVTCSYSGKIPYTRAMDHF